MDFVLAKAEIFGSKRLLFCFFCDIKKEKEREGIREDGKGQTPVIVTCNPDQTHNLDGFVPFPSADFHFCIFEHFFP